MTGIRRSALLLALVLAPVLGTLGPAHPAQATFSDSAAAPDTTVSTLTVEPPTLVEALLVSCLPAEDTVVVEWQFSPTAGVSGYQVRVYVAGGSSSVVAAVGAATKEVQVTLDRATMASSPAFTVTTQTPYGWTAESVGFEGPKC